MKDEEREALKGIRKIVFALGECNNLIVKFESSSYSTATETIKYSLTVNYQHPEQKDSWHLKFHVSSYGIIDFYEKIKIFWYYEVDKGEEDDNEK